MSTTTWTASSARDQFINFFKDKYEHSFIPSSPCVPLNDPTLLFANAGMNQFKPIFLGQVDPGSEEAKLKRAVNSQKCIRAGGKHNDLDDVGRDSYHHTMFEMLGTWSFGNYFQEEAISWAFELLVNVFGLKPERMYATYFEGDAKEGLEADLKAKELWGRFLPEDHILPGNKKDNFWEMGETGPCGPCSEIHYDRIGGRNAADKVNKDDPMVIEIWNLVFMAFNREPSGNLKPLPAKHVDTGMGFERLLSILQNKMSNYDTDVFMPLFGAISEVTGAPAYEGKYGEEDPTKKDMAYRVVADHIRTLSFSITDGALPGPVGRGFVLRRILRRAVRYGRDFLGAKVGFFSQLVPAFVKNFGGFFTEINESAERVAKVLYAEEVKFAQSYEKGIATFQSIVKDMKPGDVIPGEKVFLLYNTSGFPDDLTRIMGEERGLTIDVADFERRLNELRRASRAAQKAKAAANSLKLDAEHVAELKSKFAPTNDSFKHEILNIESKVIALFNGKNFSETKISVSENLVGVVLDSTNFYAESGGQLFDSGVLFADGVKFTVDDVQAFGGYILHIGRVSEGEVSVGSTVVCEVDNDRRTPIMSNHTATHMVNFALRTTLGSHVEQQGSTVGPDRLRFDYSHVGTVSKDNLKKADDIVCSLIAKELKVYARELPLDVATQITGIRKMFGEKYPNPVRVVSIGVSIDKIVADPANAEWANYPIELCGGTHLANVSQAQLFTIISDETVAQGVRRLVALTGDAANKAVIRAADLERKFEEIKNIKDANQKRDKFNLFVEELGKSKIPAWRKLALREAMEPVQKDILEAGKNRGKNQEKEAEEFGPKVVEELAQSKSNLYVHIMNVGGNNDVLSKTAKHIAEKSEHPVAVALLSVDDAKKGKERVICVAQVHATLVEKGLKANEWASAIAAVLGGKGGGRPNVAQGSGPAFEKVQAAFEEAKKFAQGKL